MLTVWQNKFPNAFQYNASFLRDIESDPRLLDLFSVLDSSALLNEQVVSNLLLSFNCHSDDLVALINLLKMCDCLNEATVNCLFENELPQLNAGVKELALLSNLSAENINLLFASKDPINLMAFIKRAHKSSVDLESIKHFLMQDVVVAGLRGAIELFDLSQLSYCKENFKLFSVLTDVMANPLSRTIFSKRLEAYSSYEGPREQVDVHFARDIIQQLGAIESHEDRVRVFFDCFAPLRRFPHSQKHQLRIDVDVHAEVWSVVESFCEKKIKAIENPEDYERVQKMIKTLRTEGGASAVFNPIRHSVASNIESIDIYSFRYYGDWMKEINEVLAEPLLWLPDYSKQLESSKGYRQMATQAIKRLSSVLISQEPEVEPERSNKKPRLAINI